MMYILKSLERDILHYFLVFQDSGAKGFGGEFPKIHVAMLNNRTTSQKYLTLITLFYSITIYHNSTIASLCSCRVPHLDSIELWDEKPQRPNKCHELAPFSNMSRLISSLRIFKRKCFPKDSLPSVVVNLDSLPWLLFVSQASSYPMAYLPSAKSISRMLKITHCVTAIVMSQEVK